MRILEITIPWSEVKVSRDKIINTATQEAELPGFRKGKAPKEMVAGKMDPKKIYEEVVKEIIPKVYADSLRKNSLAPISSPKINVIKAKENEDWVVSATFAIKPEIKLGAYKEKIKALKNSKTKIWTPGSGSKKEDVKKPSLDEMMQVVLAEATVEIPPILSEDEVNRMLSTLLDQTQKLGMTVEQYLMAKGITTDQLKANYSKQAENNLKLEFALSQIADDEKITITQADIDTVLAKVEKPEDRERMRQDSYYLAHLIRQQKTIDFLSAL